MKGRPGKNDGDPFQMSRDFVMVVLQRSVHEAMAHDSATRALLPIASGLDVRAWAASRGLVLSKPAEVGASEDVKP
jgi:hypothetical protein